MAKLNIIIIIIIIIFFSSLIVISECIAMPVHQGTLETGSRVYCRISVQSGAAGESLRVSEQIHKCLISIFGRGINFASFIVTCEVCCS